MKAAAMGWAAIAVACAACGSPPKHAAAERPPVAAATVRAARTDVASLFEAGGVVRARATAFVASRVMAPITDVRVRAGDRVAGGAVLVTLDARDLRANQQRADATSLSAAESVRAAEADIQTAESALRLAKLTHERMTALVATRSATQQELDQAVAALAGAEAQRAGAQARLAAANAGRDAARAAAESAAINATYTVLAAPFAGIVTERHADPGTLAAPGSALLTIEDPSAYHLEVQLDESRASLVTVGAGADVRLDTTAGGAWQHGNVIEIARVDPSSHSFVVKVELPRAPSVRSGLFGRARFSGPTRQTVTIDSASVVKRGQLTFVYALDAERHAHLRPISTGVQNDNRIEVLAGLGEGDLVIARPPAQLADGDRVSGTQP